MPVTGVICNNNIEWLGEELQDGIDPAWEEHTQECRGICDSCHCNHDGGKCSCWRTEEHEYDPIPGEHDGCGPEERGDTLIGSWKKDKDGLWEPDETGEYAAIVGEVYTQVVWSKYVNEDCRWCSPCYPDQGDLDSKDGGVEAYTLPPDLIGFTNEMS